MYIGVLVNYDSIFMTPQCIIFDCDGVLVDSETTSIAILLELGAKIGFKMDLAAAVDHFSGQSLLYCLQYMEDKTGQQFAPDVMDEFRERTFTAFRRNIQAVPGIRTVLEELQLPCCVASNAPLEKIELNLGLLDLLDFFDGHLFSAYTLQRWKPDPALFLHAAATMGYAPDQCLVIEDSPSGVQAAKAGGFTVVGIAHHAQRAHSLREAGAHHLITHMRELPQYWQ